MKPEVLITNRSLLGALACSALFVFPVNESPALETDTAPAQRVHPTLKHDPFRVPEFAREASATSRMSVSASGDGLDLRGILLSRHNPMVNINGEILKIGDVIDGYKLLDINAQHAVFEKQDNRITLKLTEEKPNSR